MPDSLRLFQIIYNTKNGNPDTFYLEYIRVTILRLTISWQPGYYSEMYQPHNKVQRRLSDSQKRAQTF